MLKTMCNAKIVFKWICLILVVTQVIDGFSYGSKKIRVRREAKNNHNNGNGNGNGNKGNGKNCANRSDFVCKNGQCVGEDKECDGIVDCDDESDESSSCHRIKCPSFLFRCKYGACIDPDKECDGKPDCRDKSDELSPKCTNITASDDNCQEKQFRCSSGQCINEDLKCDGKADCRDDSDEIAATCWNIPCPRFTYRCKYGACVDGDAECNGRVECFDGSDEDHCKKPSGNCTLPQHPKYGGWTVDGSIPESYKPQATVLGGTVLRLTCQSGHPLQGLSSVVCSDGSWSSQLPTCSVATSIFTPAPPVVFESGSCVLPKHPDNGKWTVYKASTPHQPGEPIGDGEVLQITCDKGYALNSHNSINCFNGTWSAFTGECRRICPARHSSPTLTVTCTYNGLKQKDCSKPFEGMLAKFKCAAFYEDLSLKRNPVHVCHDGSWNLQEPQCVPACGIKSVNAQTLIVNGTNVKPGDYPWQVALYKAKSKKFVCGGSMISQRVIISAAHCVSSIHNGEVYSKENYIVAVGKYYRNLDDIRDKNYVQESELEQLFVPREYKGPIQNYVADIAVLVTKKTFKLSLKVQPVCIDKGLNYNIPLGTKGFVSGWGFTIQTGNLSDELKEIEVPFVQDVTCERDLPEDYTKYLTSDKMCAGFKNQSKGVCRGDSGGGLVTKFDGRYFIAGVVSLSPRSQVGGGGCDTNEYGLYTRVSQYLDYISTIEGQFLPS